MPSRSNSSDQTSCQPGRLAAVEVVEVEAREDDCDAAGREESMTVSCAAQQNPATNASTVMNTLRCVICVSTLLTPTEAWPCRLPEAGRAT
jgi:ribosomal protein S27E